MRVAVLGAGGRMGATVCEAVSEADDLDLVAAIDPAHSGEVVSGVTIARSIDEVAAASADVVVDFTVPGVAMDNMAWSADQGIHAVVGTTGFSDADFDRLRAWYPADRSPGCIVAANFAVGAVLMMRFAELAAPWFSTAEIIELHHDAKVDAPSGTALATAERMAAASSEWSADPTRVQRIPGSRGGQGPAGIPIHSVRLRGIVANQEVLLGDVGQTLTIRHDSTDRRSFMLGVLAAVRAVSSRPGLTLGLDAVLGI